MKIMHIICCPSPGGAETYVRDLAVLMQQQGHSVVIIFLNRAVQYDGQYEQVYLNSLRSASVSYDFIGNQARFNPFWGILRLAKLVKVYRPDVIHSHLYYGALYASILPRIPKIYTHHNIKVKNSWILHKFLDWRMNAFVGICKLCTKSFQSLVRTKVVQIDNGVSATRIQKININTKSDVPIIVAVGRLTPQKNFSLLIQAIAQLKDLNFVLKIAGDGPQRADLEKLTRNFSVQDKVIFLGNVTNVPNLLSSASIFAMSSAWEGLPIAQIEATLSGLPVIVTDVGGCSEIIDIAQNGFVVPSDDLVAYSTELRRLITDHELRNSLSKNAISKSNYFTLERAVQQHLELYQSLL